MYNNFGLWIFYFQKATNKVIKFIKPYYNFLCPWKTSQSQTNSVIFISFLGEGAYSTVYKVERLKDHQIYALKKVKLANLS